MSFLVFVHLKKKKRKKISPTMNVKTVRIVTNGTFLALFKRVNHWSERDRESFSLIFYLCLPSGNSRFDDDVDVPVIRRAACITFDTS